MIQEAYIRTLLAICTLLVYPHYSWCDPHMRDFTTDTAQSVLSESERNAVMCGPNAIYTFASLHGVSMSDDHRKSLIPSHPDGMSLAEVQDACKSLGFSGRWEMCDIKLLSNYSNSFPLISFVDPFFGARSNSGHFIVILRKQDNEITFFDPTTAKIIETDERRLGRYWRGYVFNHDYRPIRYDRALLTGVLGMQMVFGAALYYWFVRRNQRRNV